MARHNPHHKVEPIYQAVEDWRDNCLLNDGSIFSKKELWTSENLNELHSSFVKKPDENEGTFFEKLEIQLKEASPSCCQLMAEILWVFHLFSTPRSLGKDNKIKHTKDVWLWSKEKFPKKPKKLSDEYLGGIANTGFFYLRRWQETAFFVAALRDLKKQNTKKILNKSKTFSQWIHDGEWLSDSKSLHDIKPIHDIVEGKTFQIRNMLLHLLFPNAFERIVTDTDKYKVLLFYKEYLPEYNYKGKKSLDKLQEKNPIIIDEMLLDLRNELKEKYGEKFDFYDPELKKNWKPLTNPSWSEQELILALEYYMLLNGKAIPERDSIEIKNLSFEIKTVGQTLELKGNGKYRSKSNVYLKLMNIAANDPSYTDKEDVGFSKPNKIDKEILNFDKTKLKELQKKAKNIRRQAEDKFNESLGDDDKPGIDEVQEGGLVTRLHKGRERSRKLVARKKKDFYKKNGNFLCEACGFDFVEIYGKQGEGFIECHHKKPVHKMKRGDTTTLDDLALVCANCHRMIHREKEWLTMEELKSILKKSAQKAVNK